MGYSQALEEQVHLRDSVRNGFSGILMRAVEHETSGRYGDVIRTRKIRVSDLPKTRWETESAIHLDYATPYFWAKNVCSIIREVSPGMPPWYLSTDALPSTCGFFWFAEPLPLPGGETLKLQCLVWGPSKRVSEGTIQPVIARALGDGIAITTWARDETDRNLIPYHYMDWWFGETPSGAAGRFKAEMIEQKHETFSTVAAMLAFLQQRILIAPEQRADRPARRRLEREGWQHEPLIRVVELRRKQVHSAQSGEHEAVEWSHQWIVSGHWRQQWYPSLNANQPRWIMPYVKGPEDKPIKPPRAKVFAVVR